MSHDLDSMAVRRLLVLLVHFPHAGAVLGEVDPDGLDLAPDTIVVLGALGSGVALVDVETGCWDARTRRQLEWVRRLGAPARPVLDVAPEAEARRLLRAIADEAKEIADAVATMTAIDLAGEGLDL